MVTYNERFFAGQESGSRRSARIIVPQVIELLHPRTVIDVGCGIGTWAAEFRAHGVKVTGVDGDYVDRDRLEIPSSDFRAVDLTEPLELDESFDLALCLEVAEHLPSDESSRLIRDLVRLAPAVLFSAAVPLQGGQGHVNERWQDEWAALFADHGYTPFDAVRPRVWDNPEVEYWYAQNMLLYTKDSSRTTEWPLRVIHPRMYELQHTKRRQTRLQRRGARLRRRVNRWRLSRTRRAGRGDEGGQPTG